MTEPVITNLPQSRVKLQFSVTPEDAQPYIDQAVTDISNARPIKGFRPGKASYEDVKRAYGEMLIWETALERIVRAHFVKAVIDNNLETIGSPEVSVEKMVPNQTIEFTTIVNIMPQVTNLADYSKQVVTKKTRKVEDATVEAAIEDLRKMRHTETAVDRASTKEDALLIDLEIKKDNVLVEGGATRDYKVHLNEAHYIPGFAEKLIGAKKGDVKTFTLKFPDDHYNKMLAGKDVEFEATVKDAYEMTLPELNDAFAKELGTESVQNLRDLLRSNLQQEQDHKANEAAEIELLEKLVKGSKFTEIPELLINEEVRRMYAELQQNAESQGMRMEDYLSSLKKTADEIKIDFVPRAIERIQTAVLIKEIGKRENIEVDDKDVETEQDRLIDSIPKGDTETRARVASPEYRDYIGVQMKNRKILEELKKKGIKEE